jgi:hypothetical protein
VLARFPYVGPVHVDAGAAGAVAPVLVAPIVDIVDGVARLDEREAAKQPDWTYGAVDSGQSPADRIDQGQALGST